jgi:hypothetical protein
MVAGFWRWVGNQKYSKGVNPACRRMLRTGIESHMTDSATIIAHAFNKKYH